MIPSACASKPTIPASPRQSAGVSFTLHMQVLYRAAIERKQAAASGGRGGLLTGRRHGAVGLLGTVRANRPRPIQSLVGVRIRAVGA